MNKKTFSAKAGSVEQKWIVIDASEYVLGRVATQIASILRGKHKPEYTPHVDTGDYVVVINAEKIKVTGNKKTDKLYHSHSGYPGGIKTTAFSKLIDDHPERVIEIAVKGMLPKGALGSKMYKKLKVYAGDQHPHASQNPQLIKL